MKMEDSAVALEELGDLTERQSTAVDGILQGIRDIIDTPNNVCDSIHLYYYRPHQIFLIEGGRGDGKTSVLLTLHRFLSRSADRNCAFGGKHAELPSRTLTLPLIIPEEMTANERIMEMVLASITLVIDHELQKSERSEGIGRNFHNNKQKLVALRDKLHREIFDGWIFAEALGLETLSRDAIDYRDFAVRRAEESVRATNRIETWRSFVDELLDAMNKKVLVVCFDDTDLAPSTADDIMTTIRFYLNHPRIVTLLSVQTEVLQSSIELTRISRISQVVAHCHPLIPEFLNKQIEMQIEEVDELIYKLLPRKFRYSLGLTSSDFLPENPLGQQIADTSAYLEKLGEQDAAGVLKMLAEDHRDTVLANLRQWISLLVALTKQVDAIKKAEAGNKKEAPWISMIVAEILAAPGFSQLMKAIRELGEPDLLRAFLENAKDVSIANNTLKFGSALFNDKRLIRLYFFFLEVAEKYTKTPQEQIDEWAVKALSVGAYPQNESLKLAVQDVQRFQSRTITEVLMLNIKKQL